MTWLQQISDWFASAKFWYLIRPWERAIRVRFGNRVVAVGPGIHFRFPLVDQIFAQNIRQRILNLPIQTVTTRLGDAITFSAVVKWRISDVRRIYETLHTPEDWIFNVVLAATSDAIYNAADGYTPQSISEQATATIAQSDAADRGLEIEGVAIIDFAKVRTIRLISGEGNSGWTWNRLGAIDAPTAH
jgi:regulator of protease activity HflC (stomatin/prohibitin superfamily)